MPLFADDMLVYVEYLKQSIKQSPWLINEFSKVTKCKINIQKLIVFLHISNEHIDTKIKNTITFEIAHTETHTQEKKESSRITKTTFK